MTPQDNDTGNQQIKNARYILRDGGSNSIVIQDGTLYDSNKPTDPIPLKEGYSDIYLDVRSAKRQDFGDLPKLRSLPPEEVPQLEQRLSEGVEDGSLLVLLELPYDTPLEERQRKEKLFRLDDPCNQRHYGSSGGMSRKRISTKLMGVVLSLD